MNTGYSLYQLTDKVLASGKHTEDLFELTFMTLFVDHQSVICPRQEKLGKLKKKNISKLLNLLSSQIYCVSSVLFELSLKSDKSLEFSCYRRKENLKTKECNIILGLNLLSLAGLKEQQEFHSFDREFKVVPIE